jgi:hypothetical protein
VESDQVLVRVSGWRRILATRSALSFPVASVVRIEHDPLARAHVKVGLRQWRKHGSGVWRAGVYHGLDGWSFWSIGLGRNAVLIECSGQRFRFVVVEVADPAETVREIRTAAARAPRPIPGGLEPHTKAVTARSEPAKPRPEAGTHRARDEAAPGQD